MTSPPSDPTCAAGIGVDRVSVAALWLHRHRDELAGPAIPALRERFALSNIEAIEATKIAHALRYARGM